MYATALNMDITLYYLGNNIFVYPIFRLILIQSHILEITNHEFPKGLSPLLNLPMVVGSSYSQDKSMKFLSLLSLV